MFYHIYKKYSFKKFIRKIKRELFGWYYFWNSYNHYKKIVNNESLLNLDNLYPCISDNTEQTFIEPVYFFQDTWAFEKIIKLKPKSHMDIGSHHNLVALLSKAIPTCMLDIRPLSLSLDTLSFIRGDTINLPFKDNTISSISSLCVVEHIGLGRYGDKLDPQGSEKAILELKRVLSVGGSLFLSLPIENVNRTYFNAHRAFSENYLFKLFFPLKIKERKYIYGDAFTDYPKPEFGIGCYHLIK